MLDGRPDAGEEGCFFGLIPLTPLFSTHRSQGSAELTCAKTWTVGKRFGVLRGLGSGGLVQLDRGRQATESGKRQQKPRGLPRTSRLAVLVRSARQSKARLRWLPP